MENDEKPRPTATLSDVERDGLDYANYQESAAPPDAIGIDPADGLPRAVAASPLEANLAPALSVARFVCMADTSKFVRRNGETGEIEIEFSPEVVIRSPNGNYWVKQSQVPVEWLANLLHLSRETAAIQIEMNPDELIGVEPIRPRCKHYWRQLFPFQNQKEHNKCQRYCAALKNDQGELLSLSDQEVLACEIREPRHPESEAMIDEFDAVVIARGMEEREEEFDIDAELAKDSKGLGILGG